MYKSNAKAVFIALLLFTLSFTINLSSLRAQQQPYRTEQVVGNLVLPTYVTSARDGSGRLFILLKGGVIKVFNPATGAMSDFLDISSRVLTTLSVNSERGLLGLAFHPQFQQNRRFFVYYTRQPDGAIQVGEYRVSAANPNIAETTEKTIITIPHPNFSNHNGGTVEFGPDGYLYLAPGDGGSANDPNANAQNINVLLGKMLRIDVNVPENSTQPYLIPPDNPFAGATPGADEIYAYGLRNPYRFSFDRGGTRQLYIADVGQNQIEEIDIGRLGANYGWRVYEGNQCTGLDPQLCEGGATPINHTPPIFQYTHTTPPEHTVPRCSVTGGYVYRGTRGTFPQGAYIFGDYCTGEIYMLQRTENSISVRLPLFDTPFLITSFGEDEQGEIYFTTNSTTNGTIQRIVNPNAAARAKVADFNGDGRTDLSVTRNSSGSKFWYVQSSSGFRAAQFGVASDLNTPGDFDGDGRTDIAVFRDGFWYSLDSSTGAFRAFKWGTTGDFPVAADYDGDGRTDYAVWRPNGFWYIYNSQTNTVRTEFFGNAGDAFGLVPADYDGDGRADVAIFRASENRWYILRSRDGFTAITWGTSGDIPVPGDYDADGKVDVAVFRQGATSGSPAFWYVLRSSNNQPLSVQWGINNDLPVPGDYDGDDRTDFAVTRDQANGKAWYILNSTSGAFRGEFFGISGDVAVPPADKP